MKTGYRLKTMTLSRLPRLAKRGMHCRDRSHVVLWS
jgi:hypothetical protein